MCKSFDFVANLKYFLHLKVKFWYAQNFENKNSLKFGVLPLQILNYFRKR